VIAGTNGEAATLTLKEKTQLVDEARKTARRLGRPDIPIVLGCSAGCTRAVIDQTVAAQAAGSNAVLILVPCAFPFAMDSASIQAFFEEVADASPIPVIIYNFPAIVSGLDVDSDMLAMLGRHANIVGVKLTCGGIAKVARVSAVFEPSQFGAMAGQSDWLLPALALGGTGCITGVANLFPKVGPNLDLISVALDPAYARVSIVLMGDHWVDMCPVVQPIPSWTDGGSPGSSEASCLGGMGFCQRRNQWNEMAGCKEVGISGGQCSLSQTISEIL
jgi:hypothetical protein